MHVAGKYKLPDQSDRFYGILREFGIRSDEGKKAVLSIAKKMEFPRSHVLEKQQAVFNYLYYIENGLSRTYCLKDGKEITDWINAENSFISPVNGFVTGQPEYGIVEFLEDSVVYAIRLNDIERLADRSHEIERFLRYISGYGLSQMQQRFDELHFSTASERYKKLMQNNSSLIIRVPPYMLASFLGVTKDNLLKIHSQS